MDQKSDGQNEELAIIIVSLVMTLLTFSLSLIGAGGALTGLKVVAARVTSTGARLSQGCRSRTGQQVVPIHDPSVPCISASACSKSLLHEHSPAKSDVSVFHQEANPQPTKEVFQSA